MAERVFCIDFGSAFTKVALRSDPSAKSSLLTPPGALLDYWVPTVVAMRQSGGRPEFVFGDQAVNLKEGGGIHVFRNFKRDLFAEMPPVTSAPTLPPLDALLRSAEFEALAARFEVGAGQIVALRSLAESARALFPRPDDVIPSAEDRRRKNAPILTQRFFAWLREQVLVACSRLKNRTLDFEQFPVRVTVPAFASEGDLLQHRGCQLLHQALLQAKWPLHPDRPFVTEPESNAVGVLTSARNILNADSDSMLLGRMLGVSQGSGSPLNTVVKGHKDHPTYRALAIDVGAYTTDFASLSIDTGGKPYIMSPENSFQVARSSVPVGIQDLDAAVIGAVPSDAAEQLRTQTAQAFVRFQQAAYSNIGVGANVGGTIVGGTHNWGLVEPHVNAFCERLVGHLRAFCATTRPASIQELILTGGGCNILPIRDALIDAAQSLMGDIASVHAPRIALAPTHHETIRNELSAEFVRGGSALGGASIFFEPEYQ